MTYKDLQAHAILDQALGIADVVSAVVYEVIANDSKDDTADIEEVGVAGFEAIAHASEATP